MAGLSFIPLNLFDNVSLNNFIYTTDSFGLPTKNIRNNALTRMSLNAREGTFTGAYAFDDIVSYRNNFPYLYDSTITEFATHTGLTITTNLDTAIKFDWNINSINELDTNMWFTILKDDGTVVLAKPDTISGSTERTYNSRNVILKHKLEDAFFDVGFRGDTGKDYYIWCKGNIKPTTEITNTLKAYMLNYYKACNDVIGVYTQDNNTAPMDYITHESNTYYIIGKIETTDKGYLLYCVKSNTASASGDSISIDESHTDIINYVDDSIDTAIGNAMNYSTSETTIGGTWIDGKPIYRKVYTGTTLTGITTDITHNIANVDNIWINGNSSVRSTGGGLGFISYPKGDVYGGNLFAYVNTTYIRIYSTIYSYIDYYAIILEYTKTTD